MEPPKSEMFAIIAVSRVDREEVQYAGGLTDREHEEPHERVRSYVDEVTSSLRMRQTGHVSGYRASNGKPEKNS